MEVTSSGRLVPTAIRVSEMTLSEMPKFVAIITALSIRIFAPITSPTHEATTRAMANVIENTGFSGISINFLC